VWVERHGDILPAVAPRNEFLGMRARFMGFAGRPHLNPEEMGVP
jgi:hypothetical protein